MSGGRRLAGWQGLLQRQPIQARQIRHRLVDGRIVFMPGEDAGGYEIRGQATYGRLLAGIVGSSSVVPPGWNAC